MFDPPSPDDPILSCSECQPINFLQVARDAHVGILLEWLNAIACWQLTAMILCSIWLVLPMFVLENEPRPRIVQWSYPASAIKYINTKYRKFLFVKPLKWVSRTRVLHEWYVKSISEYAGARGTSASKLMLVCTTMCGTLQIVLAIGMNITQLCSRLRMWTLVVGGVCCVGIGVIESALLWSSGEVKKQRKEESHKTRSALADRARTGINGRRLSDMKLHSRAMSTNSDNSTHSRVNSIPRGLSRQNSGYSSHDNHIDTDDYKIADQHNELQVPRSRIRARPSNNSRNNIIMSADAESTNSSDVYNLLKELSPGSQLRVIDRIAHRHQHTHIHENNEECDSSSSDSGSDSDKSEVDEFELLHHQSEHPIDTINEISNDQLDQPPPLLYRSSTEQDTIVDDSEKTRRVILHTLAALTLIFANWIAICFLDGGAYNRPEASIFGSVGAFIFFVFSVLQWLSGNYDTEVPHMLRTGIFLPAIMREWFYCPQGHKQWSKNNILVRLNKGQQPTLGFVGKLFILIELVSFFFVIACVPLEVIYHWNRYHMPSIGEKAIPFIYDHTRADNILMASVDL